MFSTNNAHFFGRCLGSAATLSLAGCLAATPTADRDHLVISPRQLVAELPGALPAQSADTSSWTGAGATGGTVLPSHKTVAERIGPPQSPRAAMASAGVARPGPVLAAAPRPVEPGAPTAADADVGAGIRAGQCWAQLPVEPVARHRSVQVVTADGTTRLQVRPPELRTHQQDVVVKDEAPSFRVEPPRYRQVSERVKVKDEVRRLVVVPAAYEEREESVLVESARVVLESCRTSGQRAAGAGVLPGKAQCAREVPARYETISRRVLVRPESTREEITPAVYATVTRQVLEAPARAVPETLPATTRQLPLTEVAQPAKVEAQAVAPTTTAMRVTEHEGMPRLVWRRALCESDDMAATIKSLQVALREKGLDVGTADGQLGRRTMAALKSYQQREGLAIGLVTFETLGQLGLPLPMP